MGQSADAIASNPIQLRVRISLPALGEYIIMFDGKIDVDIQYKFDKLVSVKCGNIDCINNLFNCTKENIFGCNMKYIDIDKGGMCMNKKNKTEIPTT